ncbi:MAG: hypothetical protein WD097_06630 [Balneolales bacterium]
MNKQLLIIVFAHLLIINSAYAQVSGGADENQPVVLPEAGNIGLGFDAVPFLEYLGNIFNGSTNNSVSADFPRASQQVLGKYFLTNDMALRTRLRLGQSRVTSRNRVMLDNQQIPDPDVEVTDEWVNSFSNVQVGSGLEFRRGEGKVVGVFGGEASFMYQNSTTEYDYGNPITESNQSPSSTFGMVNNGRFERIVERKTNKQLGAGLDGFIGVEYFFAPKISIGAEFMLGFSFNKVYRQQSTFEYWDTVSGTVQTRKSISEGGNSMTLSTGNYGGSINLMFHF